MKPDDVMALLKDAKVMEALEAADKVSDSKVLAKRMTEFAGSLNYLKGHNLICEALLKKSLQLDPRDFSTHWQALPPVSPSSLHCL